MTEPLVIHASSLDVAPDCMRRFAASALAAEIKAAGFVLRDSTRGIGAIIGTSVHKGSEVLMVEKAQTGRLPPSLLDIATDAAMDTLREERALGIEYDQVGFRKNPITPDRKAAEKQTRRQVKSYFDHIAPKRNPILVEHRFEAEISWSRQNIVLVGKPDMVGKELTDSKNLEIDDTKAGFRIWQHKKQCGGYALLAASDPDLKALGYEVTAANIDHVPRTWVHKSQPPPFEQKYDVRQCEQEAVETLRHIDHAVTLFREGDARTGLEPGDPAAFPANPSSFLCGAKFCRAHSVRGGNAWCTHWQKEIG